MNSFVHPQALENRLKVLTALSRENLLSKNELAAATGLSLADMSYHVRYLEESELIEAGPSEVLPASPGRPGSRFRLRNNAFEVLITQIDLPLVRLSRSRSDGSSEVVLEKNLSVKTQAELLNALRTLIAGALEPQTDGLKKNDNTWLFLSFAGVSDRAVLSSVDGIDAWRPYHLGPHFSKLLGIPVRILSAVSTLALGYSASQKGKDALVIALKAREKIFRYAEILNGKIRFGERGSSGAIGHFKVRGFDGACYCGARGCLEMFLGSKESFSKKMSALESAVESGQREAGLSARGDRVMTARGWEFSQGKIQNWRFLSREEESDLVGLGARLIALEEVHRDILLNLHPASQLDEAKKKRKKSGRVV
ncbi:MAG: ROK family transcriptional regulator [Spirochaetia bacterium]|nr:ROK family transcriptional regulator [Spirochaetia bacterium]